MGPSSFLLSIVEMPPYNKKHAVRFLSIDLVIKCPYQSNPEIPWFHRVIIGSEIIFSNEPQAMKQVVVREKDPGARDLDGQEYIQKRKSSHLLFILQMKYSGCGHIPVRIVFGSIVKIKSQIPDQCPLEKSLLPVI
jgi:hypothetical protein